MESEQVERLKQQFMDARCVAEDARKEEERAFLRWQKAEGQWFAEMKKQIEEFQQKESQAE